MAEEPADGNGQPEREKRRGRAARRRRREDVVQVTLAEPEEAEVEEIPRRKDTPTPGRRQKDQAGNFITRAFRPLTTYLQETIVELRKVTWPTRQEATRLSGIVLGVTLVSAMVLGLYNYVLSIGLDVLLRLIP
ncbi:MAG: preprotein translocase subunit SecE [Anaerolineae bacterium]|nr:preprotein translocase subunit SecE [Anaerolineae bacterium]